MHNVSVPHFKLPLSVGRGGSFETVEQDTIDEIAQCVEVLLATVEGQRIELPDYGIPDLAFEVDIPRHVIESRITKWEPRAEVLIDDEPDLVDELIRRVEVRVEG